MCKVFSDNQRKPSARPNPQPVWVLTASLKQAAGESKQHDKPTKCRPEFNPKQSCTLFSLAECQIGDQKAKEEENRKKQQQNSKNKLWWFASNTIYLTVSWHWSAAGKVCRSESSCFLTLEIKIYKGTSESKISTYLVLTGLTDIIIFTIKNNWTASICPADVKSLHMHFVCTLYYTIPL